MRWISEATSPSFSGTDNEKPPLVRVKQARDHLIYPFMACFRTTPIPAEPDSIKKKSQTSERNIHIIDRENPGTGRPESRDRPATKQDETKEQILD